MIYTFYKLQSTSKTVYLQNAPIFDIFSHSIEFECIHLNLNLVENVNLWVVSAIENEENGGIYRKI